MKIRFCEHTKGKGKIYRRLKEEFPDLNIKVKECIKQCSVCRDEAHLATVDKVQIIGRDSDDLYDKIIVAINKRRN